MGGEESETKEDKKWWQSRKKYILIGLIILIVFYVGYKFYPVKGTDVIRKMSMTKKKTCGSASQSNQIYWKEWLNDVNKVEIGDIFRPCRKSISTAPFLYIIWYMNFSLLKDRLYKVQSH